MPDLVVPVTLRHETLGVRMEAVQRDGSVERDHAIAVWVGLPPFGETTGDASLFDVLRPGDAPDAPDTDWVVRCSDRAFARVPDADLWIDFVLVSPVVAK